MNINNPLQTFCARRRNRWRAAVALLAVGVSAIVLGGCWAIPPNVLTTPDNAVPVARIFPSALLAEPIQLREGYVHTTQPFQIKGSEERWAVALGFVRSDIDRTVQQKLDGASDTCWVNNSDRNLRPKSCSNRAPGFNLRWELLRDDGVPVAEFGFDSLREDSGGTYAIDAITRSLSGFSEQPAGRYRLRITVFRDAKELDFLSPHILVNRPFFRSRLLQ